MSGNVLTAGIDVGSCSTKGVLLRDGKDVIAESSAPSSPGFGPAAEQVFLDLLGKAGIGRETLSAVAATGYGRNNARFAGARKTEIACHAAGVHFRIPGPLTVVDIGGQDNKVISVGADGGVLDFNMNRKCAAGTGAFLEEICRRLSIPLSEMDSLARSAEEDLKLGSFCTVFASTEMLKLMREGRSKATIVRASFRSVASRVAEMGNLTGRVVLSGGVAAHNPVIAGLLAEETGAKVEICPSASYAGALGAAVLASGR